VRRSELELSINWVRRLLPDDDQIVVVGSQSILGAFNEVLLPDDARLSMEVDVLPLRDPDERKADLIEVMLGRDSTFHERLGFTSTGSALRRRSSLLVGWRARSRSLRRTRRGSCRTRSHGVRILPISSPTN
jgi:hypothetical protein